MALRQLMMQAQAQLAATGQLQAVDAELRPLLQVVSNQLKVERFLRRCLSLNPPAEMQVAFILLVLFPLAYCSR